MNEYDAIIYRKRKGTSDDPYVYISEPHTVGSDGNVILREVPDRFNRVAVSGGDQSFYESESISNNTFCVNYVDGTVRFSTIHVGKSLTFTYYGVGVTYMPISRVWTKTDDGGNVIETFGDAVSNALTFYEQVNDAIENANETVQETIDARYSTTLNVTYASLKERLEDIETGRLGANVKHFGAKGDGVTDDTASIVSAIASIPASGGYLVFPKGTYVIGSFTHPDNVHFYGIDGATFSIDSQNISIPKGNQTTGAIQYYVSTTGSPLNHGLSASCPMNLVSTVLKRLPRTIWHEVGVYVSDGVYEEYTMLGEYGRETGWLIDNLTVHPLRNPTNATYPTSPFEYARLKKASKLKIQGQSMEGVIIQGRPNGVAYIEGTHGRTGVVSRIRDVWISNVTFQNWSTGILAHEGGAISGYNIKIRNCDSVALSAESQQAKIEIGNVDIVATGAYCAKAINGQISLSYGTILNGSAGNTCDVENGYLQLSNINLGSNDTTVRGGVVNQAGKVEFINCVHDRLNSLNRGGYMTVSNTIIKNGSASLQNQGGYMTISGCHVFDNGIGVNQTAGHLSIQNSDSMDGVAQKYNTTCGVRIDGGYFNYNPYTATTLGFNIKGTNGISTASTDVVYANNVKIPIDNQPKSVATFSGTGWSAQLLSNDINSFLNKSRSVGNKTTTLYAVLKNVSSISGSFVVSDCKTKLDTIVDQLVAGNIVSANTANTYKVGTTANDQANHDVIRNAFNAMLDDLVKCGQMIP